MKHHVLIMGVSGSGKSTIGKRLAETLHLPFIEADDFHSEANKEKMKKGVPLDDTDRAGWLATLADEVEMHEQTGFVLSCSALKKSYRQQISTKLSQSLRIFHLKGDKHVIADRMLKRKHYMPISLLDSQFEILEYSDDMCAIDINCSEEEIVSQIIDELNLKKSALGIIGLGVMGKSLARNFASKDIPVAVYNLPLKGEENVVNDFVKTYGATGISGAENLTELLKQLENPKIVLLMIKSGEPVDQLIQSLKKELRKGDMIIDAGNSFFKDSIRRYQELHEAGIEFVGLGVSGGEEGALLGPSLMPAGSAIAKERLMPLLQKISAKADGKDCISWSGKDGAGHFVKMVHNGIEYADMQIIAECYAIAKHELQMSNESIAIMFEKWNHTLAASYLLEISADILRHKENNKSIVDEILDVAESKGTGLWTLQEALNLQVPMPCLHAALNERIISGYKDLRVKLNNESKSVASGKLSEENLLGAMIFSRLAALAEGMHLISVASKHYEWNIDLAVLAQSWRGGCIIRSNLLLHVIEAFKEGAHIEQLFQSKTFASLLNRYMADTSQVISNLSQRNISIPLISAAFNYYKSMHTTYLPLNLIQAQRDYFGAHTYRRLDTEGQSFHTDWKK
jgi:6-phosphogluconate dehydrogenase